MTEQLSDQSGLIQGTPASPLEQISMPPEAPLGGGEPLNSPRKRRGITGLVAALALSAALLSGAEQEPVYADATPPVTIGMPLDEGKWAWTQNVNPPYTDANSSHPSVHHRPAGGDWSIDLYPKADGQEVKLIANSSGSMGLSWGTASGSCGESRRVNVSVGNKQVGWIYVTHLSDAAPTTSNPTNGMVLGKAKEITKDNKVCNPSRHIHLEFKNSPLNTYSCYKDHGNPGKALGEGVGIGTLGSDNSGAQQSCQEEATPPSAGDKAVTAVSSQITPDGTTHVYWADQTGKLKETWFKNGVKHTNVIKDFGITDVTEVSSQFTGADGLQHVYAGTSGGEVWEFWFGPNTGGYQGRLITDADSEVTAMSSMITPDGFHRIYWATRNRQLYETWFGNGQNGGTYVKDTSNSHIRAITSQYTADGSRRIYWGNDEGRLHERRINGASTELRLMADFPEEITSLASLTTPDGQQHVYSGDDAGQIRETWFNPGGSYNTWPVRNLGSAVLAISGAYTPHDGLQHIYAGSATGNLSEIWFRPGWDGSRAIYLDPAPAKITALSSQYTPNDMAQHIYWGAPDGVVRESWFGPTGSDTWSLPT